MRAGLVRVRNIAVVAAFVVATGVTATASTAATPTSGSAVTLTKTVQRTYLDNGTTTVVDKRTVTLKVDQTQNLRSLQLIHVSWSGAHPTGGSVADQNSDLAQNEEYSFLLLECRGTDSAAHPLTPETCWTQYPDERFSYGSDDPAYPAWRSDASASASERAAFVGAPAQVPSVCTTDLVGSTFERWLPFIGADNHVYPGGLFGCAGIPAEATAENLGSNLSLPSNETYGVTDAAGNGSALFDTFTGEDHASLGCSQTVACSLVAIPIMGINCDAAGTNVPAAEQPPAADVPIAKANCEATPRFAPGSVAPPGFRGTAAVDGSLWWSASNWNNRISVPLTFAPADNVCALQSSAAHVPIYGSELMIQAATQWSPAFCLNSRLFNLNHVQTPEPEARNLLSIGNIQAAYTSYPPDSPYPLPTVNSPVAMTGFGIAFTVDDAHGQPLTQLKLNARLLAKLLTESYPAQPFIRNGDAALANNPMNITQDPEFRALNPNAPSIPASDTSATLLTVNSDSDVIQALSSYINADPEARGWLNGTADPWGMVVNPRYKKMSLPVNNWPLLDTYEPLDEYQLGRIDCLFAAPTPYLPLVAAPTARLFSIGQDVEFSIAQSQTRCVLPSPIPGSLAGAKMVAQGRQSVGYRFMLGTVSLGDAAREGLSLASLQTTNTGSTTATFTDTSGRTFVAPTSAGLQAAAKLLTPDTTNGVWTLPYSSISTSTADNTAYPGSMLVYAAVPTKGLPSAALAKAYGEFLTFAAGPGQRPGTAQGDLANGYLPLTSANGLGVQAAYTLAAAGAVTQQKGYLPSLTNPVPPPPITTPSGSNSSGGQTTSSNGGSSGNTGGNTNGGGSPSGSTLATSSSGKGHPYASSSRSASPSSSGATVLAGKTATLGSGVGGWALPILLLVALVSGAAAAATRLFARGQRVG